jgi:ferric-dicitrate binding protein FerR (iron transport regulator)
MSSSEIRLEEGSVYIDNPSGSGSLTALAVHTPLGIVREIGTQFEVRLRERSLRLRVREGTVALHRADEVESAGVGTEVILGPNDSLQRQTIAPHGPEWAWVIKIAPKLDIEGRPLEDFLTWVSRETGRHVRFENESIKESTSNIVLHGTIEGLSLADALDTVLPTCGLTHRVSEEKITIGELAAEIS